MHMQCSGTMISQKQCNYDVHTIFGTIYVTTCLVVLSSRFYFWKNWQRRWTPRWTVMGMTDRRGSLVSKHLEILNFGYWNRLSELCDGAAGRTVAGTTGRHRLRNPRLGRISSNVLRDVFDYSCLNYTVSGLKLISLITWGLKEVTLS